MLYTLIILIIGRDLPQPPWARDLQARVVSSIKEMLGKNGHRPE